MTSNRNYYTKPSNYANHSTFGGVITNFDFDGHPTMSDIAARIMADRKFDERCKRDAMNRDKNKNYKKGIK